MQSEEPKSPTKKPNRKEFLKKMSKEYEDRGLTEVCVDNSQVQSLHTENNRERDINLSLQRDIEMLKAQLKRSEEIRVRQEEEILEQKTKLEQMHESHQEHVTELKQAHKTKENQLQALINKQQTHITGLSNENTDLKGQNQEALSDKDNL